MYGETKPGMQCSEFDALLADALDNVLTGTDVERFEAHKASCPSCGPMFAEARAGFRLLHALEEVEPPPMLVHNILVATIGQVPEAPVARPAEGWKGQLRQWAQPILGPIFQPRFAMSFGMAFFSISLLLHVSGLKTADLRHLDLRPAAIAKTFSEAQGKVVKYYENIRVVYEIESRVQQFKRATGSEQAPAPPKEQKQKDTTGQPDQEQYRNYSQEKDAVTLAKLLVPGNTLAHRRLS